MCTSFVSTVSAYIALNALVLTYIVYIAVLLYIVYGILFVNTVDMKIKACNALNAMLLETCQHTGVCGSYTTPYTEYYEV